MSNIDKREIHNQQLKAFITGFLSDPAHDNQSSRSLTAEVFRIALASLEAEAAGYMNRFTGRVFTLEEQPGADTDVQVYVPVYTAPPGPVSVPESAPVAYIFKHPAGRLFWSLADESNKGQSDVMPVYSAPVPAFVPPAIEPDYEVIKGILPTANPDEYACCIAADMWNACRAAMLQGAENAESPTTMKTAPALDSSPKIAESPSGINQDKSEPVTTDYKLPDDFDFDRFNDVVWLEAVASNPHMHSPTTSTIAMVALELNRKLSDRNSPVIPDGWVLVPVEPTAEMISSGITAHYERSQIQIHDRPAPGPMECAYVAMLAAAPQQEVK
ncbi:hypothetical protein [Enterobacter hormaechei]|uniref:hypothetical protein n=1 Tax=Enterobacter hormaechei TaxID=158836 RepID=UPI001FF7F5C4|nr:hypothetical protein [Enterobacter hormaechei]